MRSNPTDVTRRNLLSFACILGGALLVFALIQWHYGTTPGLWITPIALAVALVLAGLLAPRSLRPLHHGWMTLGAALGWLNTRVILTVIFFVVVTPTGLVMKLFGRSPLSTKRRDSYWKDVEPHSWGDSHVEKQF